MQDLRPRAMIDDPTTSCACDNARRDTRPPVSVYRPGPRMIPTYLVRGQRPLPSRSEIADAPSSAVPLSPTQQTISRHAGTSEETHADFISTHPVGDSGSDRLTYSVETPVARPFDHSM